MRLVKGLSGIKQTGDTIVEVLIAIAIVSLVLAGAYASTNRNVATAQDTQEHSQALQLVQSQAEFLRANYDPTSATPVPACYKSDGTAGATATDCKVSSAGVSNCLNEPCYTLSIVPPALGSSVYKVSANWDSLVGTQQNNVSLFYEP